MPENNINLSKDPLWFKDAIIYELHIKAFQDSNADGIGDFNGLIERLDYLQELGVTAIWLLPFYPSPQRDGGYDISDYYSINPDYGNVEQFRVLLKEAHKRGLKVITELVINHTSDQHPWFQKARKAPPGSPERDFYVWSDTTERYQDVRIIFQDFEKSNWTWDDEANAYYWHRFYSHQPDLNFDNPAVQEEIFNILDFWVDIGVDGFRLDAIPYLFERDNTNCENLPETHVFLKKLRAHVEKRAPHVMLLAEANMWPEDSASYFGEGDECHMNYHFPIMPRMFMSIKMEDRYPIIDIIEQTPEIPENCQWGIFLRNHDELTLEMVTDEERDYMYRAYNKDASSRINLGIRHRLAPLLDNNRQQIELMNSLLFSLPGTPVLYYGDEIGMGDNVHLGDRDGVRTPMQWNVDRNAGFSHAHPHRLYLPLINDPEYNYSTINVEVQQNNASSLLWWMKRVINIRKQFQAFGRGDIQFLSPENAKVLAFTRSYKDEHLLIVANLSRHAQSVDLELPEFERYKPVEAFGQTEFPAIRRGQNRFTIGPYGYYWFVLQPEHQNGRSAQHIPELKWKPEDWQEMAQDKKNAPVMQRLVQQFLTRTQKYNIDGRKLEQVQIVKAAPLKYEGGRSLMLIIRTLYTEGLPERYFMPLAMRKGDYRRQPNAPSASQILCQMSDGEQEGYLFEADESASFRNFLLRYLIETGGQLPKDFEFVHSARAADLPKDQPLPPARVVPTRSNHRSLAFGDQYFLKIFRRLEDAVNPEYEINSYGQDSGLPVPGYLSHLQYKPAGQPAYVLAMLEPYVPNQGTAWQYFYDSARRFIEQLSIDFEAEESEANLSQSLEERIGDMPILRAQLLGEAVAQFHKGMVNRSVAGFEPEAFSLHYQRSLFSAWNSQLRVTFQRLRKSPRMKELAPQLENFRPLIIEQLRRIYDHKLEATKIRVHGDLQLEKVLFTGKSFTLFNFEGDRTRSFSELRLRKSPISDLASLSSSLYYAAMAALSTHIKPEVLTESELLPWAEAWYEKLQDALMEGYLPIAREAQLLPDSEEDLQLLLQTFFLERQVYELGFELQQQRAWELIPYRGLLRLLERMESLTSE
jgi:maltose alpha-D-glucosyltransferase/alpha-amylase